MNDTSSEIIDELEDRASSFTGKKVLVVDDDLRSIYALRVVLNELGFEIYEAISGKEAIELLELNPLIDVVLMDIMMPEMSGLEATEAIRQQKQFIDLPIIALTARAMDADKEACFEAGVSEYLTKPIDLKQLIVALEIWLY